jgi:hypothetical protein
MIVKITPDRNISTFTLGVEDDHYVERVIFKGLPVIGEPQLVTLHWVLIDDAAIGDIVELTATEDGYAWDVTNTITQYGAEKRPVANAYIRVTTGDQVWSTQTFAVKVRALPDVDGIAAFTPGLIDQMLAAIAAHSADMAAQERRVEDMVAEGGQQLTEVEQLAGQVREDAQGVAADKAATQGLTVRAEDAADEAEAQAAGAAASAGAAEAIYTNLAGLELSVDVENGTLNLFGDMAGSVIDVVLNERNLEVYKV